MTESRTVGIVGLGYVGLPLAVEFARAGDNVIGMDISASRLASLRAGESYIEDVPSEAIREAGERIQVTSRMSSLALADAIIVCVPTPLTANREPDLGPLMDAAQALGGLVQPGQLIVLESTTYPGTTRDRLLPALEESGLKAGVDFHLAFSPERVDPGRTDYTLRTTPKIIGGHTEACGDAAESLYARVCDSVVRVSSPDVAEMAKLLENVFRSVNIALVNELALLADRMGIDIYEVVEAAATKPFGFMRFDPGPGMGGHCLPVDPFYLSWRAREFDLTTEFIELAGKVNQQMPYYCASRVEEALNDLELPVKGSRDRDPRRQLQARCRRRTRVAGAEDHRPPARPRRRHRLPRRVRRRAARLRPAQRPARRGARRRARRGDRHGASGDRLRGRRGPRSRRRPARRPARAARRSPRRPSIAVSADRSSPAPRCRRRTSRC